MPARRYLGILAVAFVVVAGCGIGATETYESVGGEPVRIAVPPDTFYSIAWLDDEVIALTRLLADGSDLSLVKPDGTPIGHLPLPPREGCVDRMAVALTRLPSGELGFGDVCADPDSSDDLLAYDHKAGSVRSLGAMSMLPTSIASDPDLTSFIYGTGSLICQGLYTHDRDGDRPTDWTVTIQGRSMNVGDGLTLGPDGCKDQGLADYPALSVDTGTTAFLGSSNAIGKDGQDRLDVHWSLMLRSADGAFSEVLDGIRYPRGLAWLPDGQQLAFTGLVGDAPGVWLVRRDGTDLRRIATVALDRIAVAPNGSTIVGLTEPTDGQSAVVTVNIKD